MLTQKDLETLLFAAQMGLSGIRISHEENREAVESAILRARSAMAS